MNCRAANRLYVRANGTVACNCDLGEHITLFKPDAVSPSGSHYVDDCYNGEPFRQLRRSFADGRPPFECCPSCFFFSPTEDFAHGGADGRLGYVENVQLESSFLCTIDCEACVPRAIRKDPEASPLGAGPYNLPPEQFRKLIDDLEERGLGVGEFCFCGRGEPLLHPFFTELMRYARKRYPTSLFTACTNANMRFVPGVLELDYVMVSIDGASQESYETYRKGGSLKTAFRFIEDTVRHRRPAVHADSPADPELVQHLRAKGRPIIRWKYILFDHTDSEEELEQAQLKARELGVDQMMFCLSHTSNRSKMYTTEEQLRTDPVFQIFNDSPVVYNNVNEEVGNIEYWEREEQRRGR